MRSGVGVVTQNNFKRAKKKKKKCQRGTNCPYQHEFQHTYEFYHGDEEEDDGGEQQRQKRGGYSKKAKFVGTGHVLDDRVVNDDDEKGGRCCSYCKRVGHTIVKCVAQGADAERRRRETKRKQKKKKEEEGEQLEEEPPQIAAAAAPSSSLILPQEYLDRVRVATESSSQRVALLKAQDDAFEESLRRDREKQEEEEMQQILLQSAREAREHQRSQFNRIHSSLPESGAVTIRFKCFDGSLMEQRFPCDRATWNDVVQFVSCQECVANKAWSGWLLRECVIQCDKEGNVMQCDTQSKLIESGKRIALTIQQEDE